MVRLVMKMAVISHRFRYPNDYKTKVTILKFERGFIEKPNDVNSKLLRQPLA